MKKRKRKTTFPKFSFLIFILLEWVEEILDAMQNIGEMRKRKDERWWREI